MVSKVSPNPGHIALAELEQLYPETWIITQNVDDLHEQAGSKQVIHLHGNIAQHKCFDDCQGKPTIIDVTMFNWTKTMARLLARLVELGCVQMLSGLEKCCPKSNSHMQHNELKL